MGKKKEDRLQALNTKLQATIKAEEKNLEKDSSEQLNKIQDDLFWVSLKLKGFGKLFFPTLPDDSREFDNEEMNGLGEMIMDFQKTIAGVHDEVETFKLNLFQKERNHGRDRERG